MQSSCTQEIRRKYEHASRTEQMERAVPAPESSDAIGESVSRGFPDTEPARDDERITRGLNALFRLGGVVKPQANTSIGISSRSVHSSGERVDARDAFRDNFRNYYYYCARAS